MTDGSIAGQAKVCHGGQHPVRAGAGVDGDGSRACLDKCEVAEVVAAGDVHVGSGTERAGRGHPQPVPRGHREVREHRRPVRRGRAEAGASHRLGRLILPTESLVGAGEALVRGAQQSDGELVAHREHELQVGDHLVRPPGIRGSKPRLGRASAGQQLRQGKAAEVLRQPEVHGRGPVQLGYRGGHVMACADLEEARQRERGGVAGVAVGQVLEVATPWPGSPLCSGLPPASWPPPSAIRASDCGKFVRSRGFPFCERRPAVIYCEPV